jgi:hypothetical protein
MDCKFKPLVLGQNQTGADTRAGGDRAGRGLDQGSGAFPDDPGRVFPRHGDQGEGRGAESRSHAVGDASGHRAEAASENGPRARIAPAAGTAMGLTSWSSGPVRPPITRRCAQPAECAANIVAATRCAGLADLSGAALQRRFHHWPGWREGEGVLRNSYPTVTVVVRQVATASDRTAEPPGSTWCPSLRCHTAAHPGGALMQAKADPAQLGCRR